MRPVVLSLKVGTKYSAEDVNCLPVDICLTDDPTGLTCDYVMVEEKDEWKKLQWNKTSFFRENFGGLENGTEVIVMDIDQEILDFQSIVDYPYKSFCSFRRWWMTEHGQMSGGLYKFRVGEHSVVDSTFTPYWQEYWVARGLVRPPVNGEQNFVEMVLGNKVEFFPDSWATKWTSSDTRNRMIQEDFHSLTGGVLRLGDEWDENIKIIHYCGTGYE